MIARCDRTGLGYQTLDFNRHMHPVATLVLDLSVNNPGNRFAWDASMQAQMSGASQYFYLRPHGWPGGPEGVVPPTPEEQRVINEFLDRIDVLYTAETPYWYWIFEQCAQRGIRTVLHFNYEYLDYLRDPTLPRPDVFLAPSLWHLEDVPAEFNAQYLPMPIPGWQPRQHPERPLRFLHIAGMPMEEDRNGTRVMAAAIPLVESPKARFNVTGRYDMRSLFDPDYRLRYSIEVKEPWMPFAITDVLVMPRRFGGLCLPLNEALAMGLPVLMPDIAPQNLFLPEEMLFDAGPSTTLQTRAPIEVHEPVPEALAERMNELAEDRAHYERLAAMVPMLAERWTWRALKPEFDRVFAGELAQ